MRFIPPWLGALAAGLAFAARAAFAQIPAETARSQSESGLTVAADVFCSETKLRTGNARIRWSLSAGARAERGITNLAAAKQTLETTVFAGGFDKGLYASIAVPSGTPPRPVAAVSAARQASPRAYQIQLIEVEQPKTAAAVDAGEISVVIENLEPGVNYTWRVVVEPAGGRIVSAPVTVRGPVCPADPIDPDDRPRPPR